MNMYSRFFYIFIFSIIFVQEGFSACSPYAGLATINEVWRNRSNDNSSSSDFVEIKLLDGNIPSTVYDDWELVARRWNGSSSGTAFSLSTFDDSNLPWLTITGTAIGDHLNLKAGKGMEAILIDGDGNTIDYLTVEGNTDLQDASCDLPYDIDFSAGSGGSPKTIKRQPDGIGDWDYETSGSEPGSGGDTNDDVDPNAPDLIIDDVSVNAGDTAVLTLTLDATFSDPITVDYITSDGTAITGTDYTGVVTTQTVTIPANTLTTTISVPTLPAGAGYFYVIISNASNAIIKDQVGIVTIFASEVAEYQFESINWNGSAGEVLDSSGNNLHGVSGGGATTDDSNPDPARPGDPGTCRYMQLGDNVFANQYAEIANNNLLNFVGDFSIATWVRIDPAGKTYDDTLIKKGSHYQIVATPSNTIRFDWGGNSLESAAVLTDDEWAHVVVTFSDGEQNIYINGAIDNNSTVAGIPASNSESLFVGSDDSSASTIGILAGTDLPLEGQIDELRLYAAAVSANQVVDIYNETRPCAVLTGPTHFVIEHDGSAIYCLDEPVTVTAANADGSPYTSYDGTITLTTGSDIGTWSLAPGSNGVLNDGGDNDGVATYTYSTAGGADDAGVAYFNLYHGDTDTTMPVSLNILVEDGLITDDDTEGLLVFSESGFSITGADFTAGTDPATLPVGTQTAGTDFSVFITAYGTTASDPVCGIIEAYHGDKTITFTHGYDNPGSGTITPTINTSAIATPITINFDQGQAEVIEKYKDVGSINLTVDDGTITGGSGNFVVKPAEFNIQPAGNPNADGADGDVYNDGIKDVVSGDTFRVEVTAIDAEGDATPNYGLENVPETIVLTHVLQDPLPASSNSGVLTGSLSLTSDVPSNGLFEGDDFSWNEVGIITLVAAVGDGDYLGIGSAETDTSITNRPNVGRFIPAYFLVESDVLGGLVNRTDPATQMDCDDTFNFLDEELILDIEITAKEKNGGTTENYENDYAKLDDVNSLGGITGILPDALNVIAEDAAGIIYKPDLRLSGTVPVIEMLKGEDDDVKVVVKILRKTDAGVLEAEPPLLATKFALNPIDTDGVESNGTETIDKIDFTLIDETNLYFGRIVIENASGSELADLPVWSHTEYCVSVDTTTTPDSCVTWQDLNRFQDPVVDSCSQLTLGAVPADLSYQGGWEGANNYNNNAATLPFLYQDFDVLQERGGGGFNLSYTAGGDGGSYTVPVVTLPETLENFHPYLLLQQGQVTFGTYRGHDKIIYWRERE